MSLIEVQLYSFTIPDNNRMKLTQSFLFCRWENKTLGRLNNSSLSSKKGLKDAQQGFRPSCVWAWDPYSWHSARMPLCLDSEAHNFATTVPSFTFLLPRHEPHCAKENSMNIATAWNVLWVKTHHLQELLVENHTSLKGSLLYIMVFTGHQEGDPRSIKFGKHLVQQH